MHDTQLIWKMWSEARWKFLANDGILIITLLTQYNS